MVESAWSLLPPIITIVLALATKEVYMSLIVGIFVGALMFTGFDLLAAIDTFFAIMSDKVGGNVYILVFLVLLGIIVAAIARSGASRAYGEWAASVIRGKRSSLLVTSILGVVIFIDDYFNCLTVGTVMRPVTDKFNVTRAKLAYIIDATAAPICIIAPVSSWAAAVSSSLPEDSAIDGFSLFLQTIPFNMYAWFTIIFMLFLIWTGKDFAAMKTLEQRSNGKLIIPEEYKEERPNLLKYLEKMPDGPTIYNLDEYGIFSLENIPFKEDATEISLYGNRISDPYTVTENLLKLENLKALWLNDNPIEETCHNFDEIGEYLKSLEIINSKFTSKAGEWALLFCCKDQKIDSLDKIEYLDLSSREFLKIKDLSIFEKLTSLHTVDIRDHKNLIKSSSEEAKGTQEKEIEGQTFEVTGYSHSLVDFFHTIPQIQNLICEDDVAEFITDNFKAGKLEELLPNLKTVNNVKITKSFNDYKVDKEVQTIMKDLWKFA